MAQVDDILQEYTNLRGNGVAAREALQRVRPMIEPLPKAARVKLTDSIRGFEAGTGQPAPKKTTSTIKSLRDSQPKLERVFCDSCGKPNRKGEIICVHCGKMLTSAKPTGSTRQLNTEDRRPEQFDVNGELLLHIRHSGDILHLHPQSYDHEVVVGRADASNVVMPDVDLTEYGAAHLGVSRLHLSITYDNTQKHIKIADMGSSNGVYINGQKLASKEERILRDGDQLQLGRFVADAAFRHDPDA